MRGILSVYIGETEIDFGYTEQESDDKVVVVVVVGTLRSPLSGTSSSDCDDAHKQARSHLAIFLNRDSSAAAARASVFHFCLPLSHSLPVTVAPQQSESKPERKLMLKMMLKKMTKTKKMTMMMLIYTRMTSYRHLVSHKS